MKQIKPSLESDYLSDSFGVIILFKPRGTLLKQIKISSMKRSIESQRNKTRKDIEPPVGSVNRKGWNEEQAMKLATKRSNHLKKGTKSELMLLQHLNYTDINYEFQAIIMKGCTFFIADFLIGMLVVEIDGKNHLTDKYIKKDLRRTRILRKWGYDVIRFTNERAYKHPEDVVRIIRERVVM